MQVAEQVRYWVSQNVQSAELTLDGLGLSPVQVSISMQGNEAHISFRTDEAATREVLQNAGAHLKDLLQGEGLVLTGVSVDSSGAGQSDRGARRGRPAVRLVTLAPAPAAGTGSAPRLRTANPGGAGRSVDLFV
jgi:flagellar hook-length control protein FliK